MTLPFGPDADMAGTWFADQAAAYLKQRRDRPFFLLVSFYEPHSPFHFPVEYRGRHKPDEFTVPKVGPEDDDQIPAVFRDLTDREKQGITASEFRQRVGEALAASPIGQVLVEESVIG